MLFGAAYYPEQRPATEWEHDLSLMVDCGVNCLRIGEFAWVRFEPAPGQYDWAWMDAFLALAAQHRIGVLLCPPLRTPPAWMVELHPDVRIEREDGVRLEFGSRYSFCITHPGLLAAGEALAARMAERYGKHAAVLGWHLDNEHGDEPDCHCPRCTTQFQEWCGARYGSIADLNAAWGNEFWGLEFSRFAQVPTPRASKTYHSPGHTLAWRRFRSAMTVAAAARQAAAVRPHAGPGQQLTTNHQCLWINRTDYRDFAPFLDVAGTNYYPPYGPTSRASALGLATIRGYRQGQNFHVHELRCAAHMIPGAKANTPAPGELARLTLHTVANGASAAIYFRWNGYPRGAEQNHGAITGFDGAPMRITAEVRDIGQRLARLSARLDATRVVSQVGVLYDYPTRWVLEQPSSWAGPVHLHRTVSVRCYEALRGLGVNVDAPGRDGDWSTLRLLVIPQLAALDDATVARLTAWVKAGGTLVTHPQVGVTDEESAIYPQRIHPGLAQLIGADVREYATAGEDEPIAFTYQNTAYHGNWFRDLPQPTTATVLATATDGQPIVLRNRVGAGQVVHCATWGSVEFCRALYRDLLAEAGIAPLLGTEPPAAIEVAERVAPSGDRLVFVINHSAASHTLAIPAGLHDLWLDEGCGSSLNVAPHGVRILARSA
jgi:beta-galactosidase